MNELYIANLVKKERMMEGIYICQSIGPIVGFLMGTYFLSSHSKKYIPMLSKINHLEENQFYKDIDFSREKFFQSDEVYAYYELKKVERYDSLDEMIEEYKNHYKKVCYYLDFTTKVPVMIRYKKK